MYSFKKYSWLISVIFAILVLISGLTANDISFLPTQYHSIAVAIIGAAALIVKIIPENYRVKIKELYDNVFLVENNLGVKSFSYSDVVTRQVKIDY